MYIFTIMIEYFISMDIYSEDRLHCHCKKSSIYCKIFVLYLSMYLIYLSIYLSVSKVIFSNGATLKKIAKSVTRSHILIQLIYCEKY